LLSGLTQHDSGFLGPEAAGAGADIGRARDGGESAVEGRDYFSVRSNRHLDIQAEPGPLR
jgi:hypothetical protein